MSQLLIQQYLNQLRDLKRVSGSKRESVVREAFKDLLKAWGKAEDLIFVPEYEIRTPARERRYVDGALLHSVRVPFGYWEAKDEKDDLDAEIRIKLRRGYPQDNIIFEDSTRAVLLQDRAEVLRTPIDDIGGLKRLLRLFFAYARPEVAEFRRAVDQFNQDLPDVLLGLRGMIDNAYSTSPQLREAAGAFLNHARESINPNVTQADVREMLIQHILTEEIFAAVFPGTPFHRDNNVARELYLLEATFFTGNTKYKTLKALEPYYAAIRSAAAQIASHHEKQNFLKVIYEGFYRVYNPKAADRLGVVYTPTEIVRFMIESTDWLCEKHFGRSLGDKNVQILDPATGTGTFICELLEHLRGRPAQLEHKYREELHANEVAILPYYVANLNIEATYAALTGNYEEFENLCLVDTLDNVGLHTAAQGAQGELFGSVTEENVARIRRQNQKTISVVIGNPPYNANQLNENENNKNREYPEIDRRIKDTYISRSTAQKTKLYDMYARFLRWASDRVAANGIIAFVSNSSFIDSRTFDGFRKVVAEEFNWIYLVDLKGNARTSGERRKQEGGNVFSDQIRVGVAVYFLVRKAGAKGCKINYEAVADYSNAEDKKTFLTANPLPRRAMAEVRPDRDGNWINQTDNDFDTLMPVASRSTKSAKKASQEKAIFRQFSLGVVTNRDEWVYAESPGAVEKKVRFLIQTYNKELNRLGSTGADQDLDAKLSDTIKWTRAVKRDLLKGKRYRFERARIIEVSYRPFVRRYLYFSPDLNEMRYLTPKFYGEGGRGRNPTICFSGASRFTVLGTSILPDLHLIGDSQCAPLYRLERGRQVENVTEWALKRFRAHYGKTARRGRRSISKEEIFHYVYAVLHDPIYQDKYAQNLRRALPKVPLYSDFFRWAKWGEKLFNLHSEIETVAAWPLRVVQSDHKNGPPRQSQSKPMLKADQLGGRILLDKETSLCDVPAEAWLYRLGSRSALEWVLELHRERAPRDATVRDRFGSYSFAGHKAQVVDLLKRVTTASVETVRILQEMQKTSR